MTTKNLTIQNRIGLHSHCASYFTREANKFKSDIRVLKEGSNPVQAKSLLGVLSLGITGGVEITVTADGPDEEEAIAALSKLVENGFADAE